MNRYDRLMALQFPQIEHRYTPRDVMLYALGVGYGADPMDLAQLDFAVEARLKVAPTMAVVLAYPGFWYRDLDTGLDFQKVVHGSESVTLDRPLPAEARVAAQNRVVGIIDKGPGKGALVTTRREIVDMGSGERLATVAQTAFCRGDGGIGGPAGAAPQPHPLPQREPDIICTLPTQPQAALIYRLSGDPNPLHHDPGFALAAGYPRPILHGLATYGVVGHALLRSACSYDPARLRSMECRFSAPVFPGDAVRTEIWLDGTVLSFRAFVGERMVVNNGRATFVGASA